MSKSHETIITINYHKIIKAEIGPVCTMVFKHLPGRWPVFLFGECVGCAYSSAGDAIRIF